MFFKRRRTRHAKRDRACTTEPVPAHPVPSGPLALEWRVSLAHRMFGSRLAADGLPRERSEDAPSAESPRHTGTFGPRWP